MSVQDALAFIQKIGSRPDLQAKLRLLGDHAEIADLIAFGGSQGHSFTADELQTAFARDWSMRRLFFCGGRTAE